MAIVPLPWHDYPWLKLHYAALLMEVTADSCEVIEQKSEAVGLFAEDESDLIELKLVEYFLVQRYHVLVDPDAVDKDLYV